MSETKIVMKGKGWKIVKEGEKFSVDYLGKIVFEAPYRKEAYSFVKENIVGKVNPSFDSGARVVSVSAPAPVVSEEGFIPKVEHFFDWNKVVGKLGVAYENRMNVLIVGDKGSGKTMAVMKFAEELQKKLFSVNMSLRTRESHLVGGMHLEGNESKFVYGVVPKSMIDGGILYLDELNASEPDVLIRLDEVLDDRRQVVMKENRGETIKAHDDWFVVATINPLTHLGTKELPQQLLSRFPVRIYVDYPDGYTELSMADAQFNFSSEEYATMKKIIKFSGILREASKVELPYAPSLRETMASAKLLKAGVKAFAIVEVIYENVYRIYGNEEISKIRDFYVSVFGSDEYDS